MLQNKREYRCKTGDDKTENMDVFNIGDQILTSVQDAVSSGDFSGLNRTIRNVINSGGDSNYWSVDTNPGGSGQTRQKTYSQTTKNGSTTKQTWQTQTSGTGSSFQAPSAYVTKVPGSVSGVVLQAVGYPLTAFNALMMLGGAAFGLAGMFGAAVAMTSVFGVLTIGSFCVGLAGYYQRGRAKRFKQYVARLNGKDFCTVDDLALSVGKKKEFVVKDLEKMIRKNFFRQGRFDEKKTTFMGTDAVYQQYLLAQESMKQREEREAAQKAEEEKIYKNPNMTEESRKLLKEGQSYIEHIRACNDAIPGEEISAKLYRLEQIMTRIFKQVEKQPELASDLRKFMNYYLPTTAKLVEAYKDLDQETVESENITRTKREIEDTIDTINEAFEKLLDSFFEEKAWDISSDINVMKSMLKQDGMTDKDF